MKMLEVFFGNIKGDTAREMGCDRVRKFFDATYKGNDESYGVFAERLRSVRQELLGASHEHSLSDLQKGILSGISEFDIDPQLNQ